MRTLGFCLDLLFTAVSLIAGLCGIAFGSNKSRQIQIKDRVQALCCLALGPATYLTLYFFAFGILAYAAVTLLFLLPLLAASVILFFIGKAVAQSVG